jgi:hypothetical protein
MRVRVGIPAPGVVITDQETALKNALAETFPEARQQLCIFHHNKNAILNIKKKWKQPPVNEDDPDHLYQYDEAGNPLPTQSSGLADQQKHSLDAGDMHDLEELNAPGRARTGAWITLGQLPDRVEHSKAGIYLLWKHMI